MESNWRIIVLGIWLLILWVWENLTPLRSHNRAHLWSNVLFSLLTIVINLFLVFVLIALIDFNKRNNLGTFNIAEVPYSLQLIVGVVILDLIAAYLSHYIMHQFGFLWRFHQVHHLDEMIDVTSGLRQHPLETIYRFAFLISGVTILGAPLSVVVIYQTVSALNALFEHSNITLNSKLDSILNKVIVTPNAHKVHHSSEQQFTDSNYGNIFSIWDRLFKTYRKIDRVETINYGLDGSAKINVNNAYDMLKIPFIKKARRESAEQNFRRQ